MAAFSVAIAGFILVSGLSGFAAAASLVDGGFESGTLAGPEPTGPVAPSFGFWTRATDDSRLVNPPDPVHAGQWAAKVDTMASPRGSYVYQDFDSGTLSYVWTLWVIRSEGTNWAELIYNWDRGTGGFAEFGSRFIFTPTITNFTGWKASMTFGPIPADAWHELRVDANRCTGTQEVRLDGVPIGGVTAAIAPPSGIATAILGDVANNALKGRYYFDDVAFDLYDCSAPRGNPCPLSQGFWKTHPARWPVDSLVLGDETYAKADVHATLSRPTRGDASLILARQLIAAKLNLANGSDPGPVTQTISDSDALLAPLPGRLPYGTAPSSDTGGKMTTLARVLDSYNNGGLTPDCLASAEPPTVSNSGSQKELPRLLVLGLAAFLGRDAQHPGRERSDVISRAVPLHPVSTEPATY